MSDDVPAGIGDLPADRVAQAVAALAEASTDPHLRTQLHALVGVVSNLAVPEQADDARVLAQLREAMATGDEDATVRAARSLARDRRARVARTDWTRASR